jgi:hypothetical protein
MTNVYKIIFGRPESYSDYLGDKGNRSIILKWILKTNASMD